MCLPSLSISIHIASRFWARPSYPGFDFAWEANELLRSISHWPPVYLIHQAFARSSMVLLKIFLFGHFQRKLELENELQKTSNAYMQWAASLSLHILYLALMWHAGYDPSHRMDQNSNQALFCMFCRLVWNYCTRIGAWVVITRERKVSALWLHCNILPWSISWWKN